MFWRYLNPSMVIFSSDILLPFPNSNDLNSCESIYCLACICFGIKNGAGWWESAKSLDFLKKTYICQPVTQHVGPNKCSAKQIQPSSNHHQNKVEAVCFYSVISIYLYGYLFALSVFIMCVVFISVFIYIYINTCKLNIHK